MSIQEIWVTGKGGVNKDGDTDIMVVLASQDFAGVMNKIRSFDSVAAKPDNSWIGETGENSRYRTEPLVRLDQNAVGGRQILVINEPDMRVQISAEGPSGSRTENFVHVDINLDHKPTDADLVKIANTLEKYGIGTKGDPIPHNIGGEIHTVAIGGNAMDLAADMKGYFDYNQANPANMTHSVAAANVMRGNRVVKESNAR